MNVLFVSCKAPPEGGARSARVASLGRWLMRRGHYLEVLTVESAAADRYLLSKLDGATIGRRSAGIAQLASAARFSAAGEGAHSRRMVVESARRIVKLALVPDAYIGAAVSLARYQPALQPDVVVSFIPPFSGALVGHRIAGRFNVPHVVDYGDPWSSRLEPIPAVRRSIEFQMERRVLKRAAAAVVNSWRTKALMDTRFGQVARTECILSGFDPDDFSGNVPAVSGELRYVGSLYEIRLPLAPIAAAARGSVFQRVVSYGRRNRVDLPAGFEERPAVSYRESLDLMETAGALLVVGNHGGLQLPSKIYNYIGSGRPIIAVVESMSDAICDLDLGDQAIVTVSDSASLETAFRNLASRVPSRYTPSSLYTWEAAATQYECLLRIVAERRRPSGAAANRASQ